MIDGPSVGALESGPRNSITDVVGVLVGHVTVANGATQTGVTVVRPHSGDAYRHPVAAAAVVINGFGKTTGLLQLNELGVLESPIALTNTFAVGTIYTAMLKHAVRSNASMGRTAPTLNPVVAECNDGWLNDLHAFAIAEDDYVRAFDAAGASFEQGAIGAGRGMSCFGLKGGIGSASRVAANSGRRFVVGALVLANFGRLRQLTLTGVPVGERIALADVALPARDDGSIIVVIATDAP